MNREALRRLSIETARTVLGDDTRIAIELVDDIPRTTQGKVLRVVGLRQPERS